MNSSMDAVTATDHLIGNLFFNLGLIPTMAARLHPDALPIESPGRTVYREMCRLHISPDEKLSPGTLESALRGVGFDFAYLTGLQARIYPETIDVLEGYADAINNAADLESLRQQLAGVIDASRKAGANVQQLLPSAMQQLASVQRSNANTLRPLSDVMQDVMAEMESWQNGTALQGESTGFPDIDKIMRLNAGELILCAARPSMGKSALAMAIAENVARNNPLGSVLVFSAEMTSRSLGHRMVSARASVNGHRLRTAIADANEFDQAFTAATDLGNLPLYIDESSNITTEQIYYRAAMANQQRNVKLIVFDFVELGADEPAKRSDGEEQRISMIARGLKSIAKNLGVPVLALSQLNRDCEKRQDKLPMLADLRYSGMLEQVADVVMFIMRPEYYISKNQSCYLDESVSKLDYRDGKHPHSAGVAYLMIAKQRNGPTGRVNLAYIGKYVKFASLGTN